MKIPLKLTQAAPIGRIETPPSCNGFQIFWEIVDATTGDAVDPSGVTLAFEIELPGGTLIPFDVSPVSANTYQIEPTACGGGIGVKVTAAGLSASNIANIYMIGLF